MCRSSIRTAKSSGPSEERLHGLRKRREADTQRLPPGGCAHLAGADHRQQRQHDRQARPGGLRRPRPGEGVQSGRRSVHHQLQRIRVLAKEFTNNIKDLENALRNLDAKGETAMRDALAVGDRAPAASRPQDKKVLLVVTDGEDNSSVETQAHLVEVAQQNDVIIYAVGLLGAEEPESAARAKKQLSELTQQTGGQCLVSKRRRRDCQHHPRYCPRNPQSIRGGLYAHEPGGRRQLSQDPRGCECSRRAGAHARRLLRAEMRSGVPWRTLQRAGRTFKSRCGYGN